jgi:hypothetical protein
MEMIRLRVWAVNTVTSLASGDLSRVEGSGDASNLLDHLATRILD